jgi:hypothetical protein
MFQASCARSIAWSSAASCRHMEFDRTTTITSSELIERMEFSGKTFIASYELEIGF